ncbi:MAG TPA: GNAT family N-acetyltransferase [Gammaproteobacteria bacterium]|jgi:GNAT superfamily N-acetyltransferase|nr:GNAT family N-acetyltransferase [Gammaproteobacteria bacterium]
MSDSKSQTELVVRPATINDTATIHQFVVDLAIYEKAEHEAKATEQDFVDTLFCEAPQAFALIAQMGAEAVGFAIYFFSYSTWLGKHGIYLEDLYVTPECRGKGAGKALLQELAKIAVAKDCGRVEWSVLDWNEPSIQFYKSIGAEAKDGWTVYRLEDDTLTNFANS